MEEKYEHIIDMLIEQTKTSKIIWQVGIDKNTFFTSSLDEISFHVSQGTYFYFKIFNELGEKIEELSTLHNTFKINELFLCARRSVYKTDEALSLIIKLLEES